MSLRRWIASASSDNGGSDKPSTENDANEARQQHDASPEWLRCGKILHAYPTIAPRVCKRSMLAYRWRSAKPCAMVGTGSARTAGPQGRITAIGTQAHPVTGRIISAQVQRRTAHAVHHHGPADHGGLADDDGAAGAGAAGAIDAAGADDRVGVGRFRRSWWRQRRKQWRTAISSKERSVWSAGTGTR